MKIKLTATCPDCDEEMSFYIVDLTGNNPTVDLAHFEQVTFDCKNCNKKFYTGDIDLLSEEEL